MSESQSRDEGGQFTAGDSDGTDAEQQYEHIVLIADAPLSADKQERIAEVLDGACDEEGFELVGHEFGDDRVHLFVENPDGVASVNVAERLKITSHRRYNYHPTFYDSFRWARGLSAGTVESPGLS